MLRSLTLAGFEVWFGWLFAGGQTEKSRDEVCERRDAMSLFSPPIPLTPLGNKNTELFAGRDGL